MKIYQNKKKRKKRKRPLRKPEQECNVKTQRGCCQQRKGPWKRQREKMREKKRKKDKRAKQERNLASNESIAVWQWVLPTSGNARTGWHSLRSCKRGFCSLGTGVVGWHCQTGRRAGREQTLRPAHTDRQLNKSLPSLETDRYGERGRRKMSDFLAATDRKWKKSSRER